jgi:hypothetical protein
MAGAWRWPLTPSSVHVKERLELYLYSSGSSWPVLEWTLPLPSGESWNTDATPTVGMSRIVIRISGIISVKSQFQWPRVLRPRLHCSQNRHNTANQHLSGYTSQAHVAIFNATCLSRLTATQGLFVLGLLVVSDVKTHQKHVVFVFVGLGLFFYQPLFHKFHFSFLQM